MGAAAGAAAAADPAVPRGPAALAALALAAARLPRALGVRAGPIVAGNLPALAARHVRVDSLGERASGGASGFGGSGVAISAIFFVGFAILSLAFIGRQAVAFARAAGERREQLKWLMSGAAAATAGAVATVVLGDSSSPILAAIAAIGYLALAALPLAIGIGVLRHRLCDIDRLVSRTLSYAILTALLAGAFVGLVALSTDALALPGRVGVAASTLVAFVLFTPLRTRVQRLVDRRFDRARHDADAIVAAFTARVRDAVEIDGIREELLGAVAAAVAPDRASLWIRP